MSSKDLDLKGTYTGRSSRFDTKKTRKARGTNQQERGAIKKEMREKVVEEVKVKLEKKRGNGWY